jgi:hypothetical protein
MPPNRSPNKRKRSPTGLNDRGTSPGLKDPAPITLTGYEASLLSGEEYSELGKLLESREDDVRGGRLIKWIRERGRARDGEDEEEVWVDRYVQLD